MNKIKVAYSQRIIPHYRLPVFQELSMQTDIEFCAYFGTGFKKGSQANAIQIFGFNHKKLFTISLSFLARDRHQLIVFHPTLFFHLFVNNYDVVIVEPGTNIFNDILVFLYCKIFKKKFIWYEVGAVPKNERTRNRKMIDPVVEFLTRKANCYITYNSFADEYLRENFGILSNKIFRAQNALDTSKILNDIEKYQSKVEIKKAELGINKEKIALFIGGVEKRKKINNLITAIFNLNKSGIPSKTLVIGDGPDIDWVKQKCSSDELKCTLFLGSQIEEAVLYILLSQVVVLPAQGGLSINHAFACKKPFIGTKECVSPDTNSIYDYVIDGYNGYVVNKDDISALEEKLNLIFTNEELYLKLCCGASETSQRIDIPNMVRGIYNAIKYSVENESTPSK